jgi:pantothenate kinase
VIDAAAVAAILCERAGDAPRFMVAIVGPPGAGKTTFADQLRDALKASGESAVVVPMDGFHFDDAILNARGHRPRKGAPFTFDVRGFEVLLKRIKAREADIAIPVFDRTMELSRSAADLVDDHTKFILVEGLYLLLKQTPWDKLKPLFDFTVFLNVPAEELKRRLVGRIMSLGFDMEHALNWIATNDELNMRAVLDESSEADLVISAA